MDNLGGFIAEQIAKAVRDAQARQQAQGQAPAAGSNPPRPGSVADLRAQVQAEAARRAARSGRPGAPGTAAPRPPAGAPAPPRRLPAFGAQTPPAPPRPAAPPPVPRVVAPPPPLAPDTLLGFAGVGGFDGLHAPTALSTGTDAAFATAPPRLDVGAIFANPASLLGAIVVGEALAPPLSLRPGGVARPPS